MVQEPVLESNDDVLFCLLMVHMCTSSVKGRIPFTGQQNFIQNFLSLSSMLSFTKYITQACVQCMLVLKINGDFAVTVCNTLLQSQEYYIGKKPQHGGWLLDLAKVTSVAAEGHTLITPTLSFSSYTILLRLNACVECVGCLWSNVCCDRNLSCGE